MRIKQIVTSRGEIVNVDLDAMTQIQPIRVSINSIIKTCNQSIENDKLKKVSKELVKGFSVRSYLAKC